jgi:hypothetical protein
VQPTVTRWERQSIGYDDPEFTAASLIANIVYRSSGIKEVLKCGENLNNRRAKASWARVDAEFATSAAA